MASKIDPGSNGAPSPAGGGGLYHLIWRWHFYAGLIVAPFVIILAATGALYLFHDEIEKVVYRDLIRVEATSERVDPVVQERTVLTAYPESSIRRYTAPRHADQASEWQLVTADGRSLVAFVDPGSGRVTGDMPSKDRLMSIVSELHGELLLGKPGDYLVEFAGCWAFVLLVTGLFLWWPRRERSMGVAMPRLNARGRSFWRDLHAVPSMWNAPVVAFLILTGLPWSGFWGEQLAKFGTVTEATQPSPNFRAAPKALTAAPLVGRREVHDHDEVTATLPWSARKHGVPRLEAAKANFDFRHAMALARQSGIAEPGLRVMYPADETGVFTLNYIPDQAQGQRTIYVDPASGAIIEDIGWNQYSPLAKAVEFGVETHVGRQFGLANQIVMAISCVLLIATVGMGVFMWWRRRPPGRIGVPPIPKGYRPPGAVLIVAAALGVIFPLVGASMLVILLVEIVLEHKRS